MSSRDRPLQVLLFGQPGDQIHKKLQDKSYEERKQASMKIEEAMRADPTLDPGRVIQYLRSSFLQPSANPNQKKGGLIGTAAVAIALQSDTARQNKHLQELVDNAVDFLQDEDSRVRYYACEALYNVSKSAGALILSHFKSIFDGLIKLSADVDMDVRSGVQVLDRLMKDIVTQNYAIFEMPEFLKLLEQRVGAINPHIRHLVLSWIKLLVCDMHSESSKQAEQLVALPKEVLSGLFKMLADPSRDVRQSADSCLSALLRHTENAPDQQALKVIGATSGIVANECFELDKTVRLNAQIWLHQFVRTLTTVIRQGTGEVPEPWLDLLPTILKATLICMRDTEGEVAKMAVDTHAGLLEMVHNLGAKKVLNLSEMVDQLVNFMGESGSSPNHMVVRTACLQWVCMLMALSPDGISKSATFPSSAADDKKRDMNLRDKILRPVLDTLRHSETEVVVAALKVLAQVMEGRTLQPTLPANLDRPATPGFEEAAFNDSMFRQVTDKILDLFEEDRQLLEMRGQLMIRELCNHLDVRRLYVTVAQYIRNKSSNIQFAQQLVQTFSWILLTAHETKELREELLATGSLELAREQREGTQRVALFLELLDPWFHNPVSALALCLWSQQYELASELVARFAVLEPTIDFLTQLDQLVYLIDSPGFSRLRLQLLEPRSHAHLFKCLLGLSMLLPQARAFAILQERLQVMHSSLLLEATTPPRTAEGGTSGKNWLTSFSGAPSPEKAQKDVSKLLELFDEKAAQLAKLRSSSPH